MTQTKNHSFLFLLHSTIYTLSLYFSGGTNLAHFTSANFWCLVIKSLLRYLATEAQYSAECICQALVFIPALTHNSGVNASKDPIPIRQVYNQLVRSPNLAI